MGKEQKALLTSVESRHGQRLWTKMRGRSSSPGGGFPAPALGSRDIQERSQRWLQSIQKGPCLGQVIDLSYHCGIFLANLLCSKIQVTRGAALPAGCWFPAGSFPLLWLQCFACIPKHPGHGRQRRCQPPALGAAPQQPCASKSRRW